MAMNEETKAIHQIGKILETLDRPTAEAVVMLFARKYGVVVRERPAAE